VCEENQIPTVGSHLPMLMLSINSRHKHSQVRRDSHNSQYVVDSRERKEKKSLVYAFQRS